MMNELQIVEHENQRVLTTAQLSDAFGADAKTINRNFQRNTERFKHGKHYFSLSGQELQEFKGSRQNDVSLKYTSVLYLWTEKGAWLHAKSLNTDQAWEAYEKLIDEYYDVIHLVKPKSQLEIMQMAVDELSQQDKRITLLEETMRIDGVQEYQLNQKGKNKVIKCLGGYQSPAYQKLAGKLFARFWRDFKQHFTIPRYSELPKRQFDEALEYVSEWQPDTSTRLEIQNINRQQTMQDVV